MQHNFTVGVPIDVAWSALLDPERVAPCMPGAKLTKAEGSEFAGSVKVKLGPISLLYKGTGTFSEIDESARRVVIDASGKDARGAGTAAATVTAVLSDEGSSTSVRVDTDLKVTGKPAQLGRGLITEVGGRILDQFASCLAERLVGEASGSADGATGSTAGIAAGASTGASSGTPSGEEAGESSEPAGRNTAAGATSGNGDKAASAARHPSRATGGRPAWRVTQPSGTDIGHTEIVTADTVDETAASASTVEETPSDTADAVVTGRGVPQEESIDLLGAAGLPVVKRVAPVAAGLVVVLVLRRLLRRRRNRRR